jgi:hypothetical protein
VALVDDGELSVLPRSHSQNESENIGLLLSPKLFEILVGTHLSFFFIIKYKERRRSPIYQ